MSEILLCSSSNIKSLFVHKTYVDQIFKCFQYQQFLPWNCRKVRTCQKLPEFKRPATLAIHVAAVDFQRCDKTIHTELLKYSQNVIPQTNVLPFSGVNTKSNQINITMIKSAHVIMDRNQQYITSAFSNSITEYLVE